VTADGDRPAPCRDTGCGWTEAAVGGSGRCRPGSARHLGGAVARRRPLPACGGGSGPGALPLGRGRGFWMVAPAEGAGTHAEAAASPPWCWPASSLLWTRRCFPAAPGPRATGEGWPTWAMTPSRPCGFSRRGSEGHEAGQEDSDMRLEDTIKAVVRRGKGMPRGRIRGAGAGAPGQDGRRDPRQRAGGGGPPPAGGRTWPNRGSLPIASSWSPSSRNLPARETIYRRKVHLLTLPLATRACDPVAARRIPIGPRSFTFLWPPSAGAPVARPLPAPTEPAPHLALRRQGEDIAPPDSNP